MPIPVPIDGANPNPSFMPALRTVTAITNAFPALVTTSFAHGYITGMIGRLYIPPNFGMEQANQLLGTISVVSPTTFYISIDTTSFDPFVVPSAQPGYNYTSAQIVPVGEVTSSFQSTFENVLPPLF